MTVRVTGVGFFDLNHLQVGRCWSCIELHPARNRPAEVSRHERGEIRCGPVAERPSWCYRSVVLQED
jgi:hypothetical protein